MTYVNRKPISSRRRGNPKDDARLSIILSYDLVASPLKIILRISWEQSRKEIQNNPLSLSNYSDKTHGEMNSYFEEESLKTNLWKYVAWKSEPNPTRASFVRPPSSKKNFDLINPKSENFSEIWRFQVWFN